MQHKFEHELLIKFDYLIQTQTQTHLNKLKHRNSLSLNFEFGTCLLTLTIYSSVMYISAVLILLEGVGVDVRSIRIQLPIIVKSINPILISSFLPFY
jgi:hypothetical protein